MAVIVPWPGRLELTDDEEISLRHANHFLGEYDRYLLLPEDMPVPREGFGARRFAGRYFGSAAAHCRLLLSERFYRAFADYEYILIYHLDALAFDSNLSRWCDLGYDYIGPPWLKSMLDPSADGASGFGGVGGGGFSLRRVSSFLSVLTSRRHAEDPEAAWRKYHGGKPLTRRLVNLPKRYLKRLSRFNNVSREISGVSYNEDLYWWHRARWFNPGFTFAPVDVALRFAFEENPRYCFEQNGRRLPFGCHGWPKHDRPFWEPHLLATGPRTPSPHCV